MIVGILGNHINEIDSKDVFAARSLCVLLFLSLCQFPKLTVSHPASCRFQAQLWTWRVLHLGKVPKMKKLSRNEPQKRQCASVSKHCG